MRGIGWRRTSGWVVWVVGPLVEILMKIKATRVSRLWVAFELLIFVSKSVKSGVILLLFIRAKSFYGLRDHGFDRGFGEGCISCRVRRKIGSGGEDCLGLTLFQTHLVPFHLRTVGFPGMGVLRI